MGTISGFAGLIALFVMLPLTYTISWWALHTLQAPTWVWVIWIIQVPVAIVLGIMTAVAKFCDEQ